MRSALRYLAAAASLAVGALGFEAYASNNVAVYWGQGAYQGPLTETCDVAAIDIVIVAFVHIFPDQAGSHGYPGSNFGNACDLPYATINGTETFFLASCPAIETGVKYCQSKGKKVLLSLGGGANPTYYVASPDSAAKFATFLWKSFGPVDPASTLPRPFGDAVIDGFDFDIESDSSVNQNGNYDIMANYFRALWMNEPKTYYLSAAPQCVVPDARLDVALSNAWFDWVFIQFYNTPKCSARAGYNKITAGGTDDISWNEWTDWIANNAFDMSKNFIKLYVGLPAAPGAAAPNNYLNPAQVSVVLENIKTSPYFGGIMLWEATFSKNNTACGKDYATWMEMIVDGSSTVASEYNICNPTPTSTAPPTASTVTSVDGTCGYDPVSLLTTICGTGFCCSQGGYCGAGEAWCGAGCQPKFGVCDSTRSSVTVSAPTSTATVTSVDGTCGKDASSGVTKICPDSTCCSVGGYCGSGDAWCGAGCQPLFGKCSAGSSTTSSAPAASGTVVSTDGNCGKEGALTKLCPESTCCSEFGFCGVTTHCGSGCQPLFGYCPPSSSSSNGSGASSTSCSSSTTSPATTAVSSVYVSSVSSVDDGSHHSRSSYSHVSHTVSEYESSSSHTHSVRSHSSASGIHTIDPGHLSRSRFSESDYETSSSSVSRTRGSHASASASVSGHGGHHSDAEPSGSHTRGSHASASASASVSRHGGQHSDAEPSGSRTRGSHASASASGSGHGGHHSDAEPSGSHTRSSRPARSSASGAHTYNGGHNSRSRGPHASQSDYDPSGGHVSRTRSFPPHPSASDYNGGHHGGGNGHNHASESDEPGHVSKTRSYHAHPSHTDNGGHGGHGGHHGGGHGHASESDEAGHVSKTRSHGAHPSASDPESEDPVKHSRTRSHPSHPTGTGIWNGNHGHGHGHEHDDDDESEGHSKISRTRAYPPHPTHSKGWHPHDSEDDWEDEECDENGDPVYTKPGHKSRSRAHHPAPTDEPTHPKPSHKSRSKKPHPTKPAHDGEDDEDCDEDEDGYSHSIKRHSATKTPVPSGDPAHTRVRSHKPRPTKSHGHYDPEDEEDCDEDDDTVSYSRKPHASVTSKPVVPHASSGTHVKPTSSVYDPETPEPEEPEEPETHPHKSTRVPYASDPAHTPVGPVVTPKPSDKPEDPSTTITTVITTTYVDICPTGFTTETITYTTTYCPATTTEAGAVPPGWTSTVTVCTVCGAKPTTVTLTKPVEVAPTEAPGKPSTIYSTRVVTVTKCPAGTHNCPADQQTTKVVTTSVAIGTTVIPPAQHGTPVYTASTVIVSQVIVTPVPVYPIAGGNGTAPGATGAAAGTGAPGARTSSPSQFTGAAAGRAEATFGLGFVAFVAMFFL